MPSPRSDQKPGTTHPAPNFRWAFRVIRLNRLWLLSAVMLAASYTIVKHLSEKPSFVSSAVLALETHEQKNIFGGVPGLTTGDNFLPRTFTIMEQFKSEENCALIKKIIRHGMYKSKISLPAFQLDENSACASISFQPDVERMQLRIVSRAEDPFLAQYSASAAAHIVIQTDQKRLRRKISEMKGFLANQEKELGVQLRQIENEKAQFQASNAIITGEPSENQITQRLEQAEQEYLDLQVQIRNNEALLQQSKKSIEDVKSHVNKGDGRVSSLLLSQVQYRLNMLQYRKSTMKAGVDPETIKKIDSEIAEIMKVYQTALEGKGDAQLTLGGDPIE